MKNTQGKTTIWVRVPNLPIHCYNFEFLWNLGNIIGKSLKVDLKTLAYEQSDKSIIERGRFARVCVEIDLQNLLSSRVIVRDMALNVEYESLNLICFQCGRYGHRREECPWTIREKDSLEENNQMAMEEDQAQNSNPEKTEQRTEAIEEFGPWMLVRKTTKSRTPQSEVNGRVKGTKAGKIEQRDASNAPLTKSRFAALSEPEADLLTTDANLNMVVETDNLQPGESGKGSYRNSMKKSNL